MPLKKPLVPNFDVYTKLMSSVPGIEIKGAAMPYTSVNGNMFSFLKDGMVALRLPEKEREDFVKKYKSSLFKSYGAVLKEYVTVSEKQLENTKVLLPYAIKSYEYAKTLKPKAT